MSEPLLWDVAPVEVPPCDCRTVALPMVENWQSTVAQEGVYMGSRKRPGEQGEVFVLKCRRYERGCKFG